MAAGVYVITNIENDKAYIGSTIDFEIRWYTHRGNLRRNDHGNPHLQSSWNKYGKDAFEFGILEYLDNLDELGEAEQFWMDLYREEGRELYNIALTTGCPMLGLKHSEEAKCKMREAAKTRLPMSEETRQKLSKANKGKPPSEACRLAVSEANRRRVFSEETRLRMSESHKGRKHGPMSEKQKREIGDANRGKKHSEEAKRKISKAGRGRVVSKETRRRNSEAQKARWAKSKVLGFKGGRLSR